MTTGECCHAAEFFVKLFVRLWYLFRNTRRSTMHRAIRFALALASIMLALPAAAQQAYPAKTVRIIVPFAAGGPADIYARAVGEKLSVALGQPFVIEDKPGGGSIVGTDAAAKSAPDGYTLLMMSNTHTVNESLIPNRPFELMRDFVPVAPVNYSDLVLVVHPSVDAATLKEFIALAKAKPGALNYASSGSGTPYHMAGELFKASAGVDIVHVPYKGSSGARTDLLGGQVQMMFDAITTMAPIVRAGKLKALGTTGKTRSGVLPEVPTVSEAGVPGYETVIWLGIMAPAGTPKAIVEKLNVEITKIVNNPEMREAWAKQGAVPMSMSTEEFARYMRDDIDKWARIVRISGAKPD
jgi:tripartite-type tricarboxylate transporter receptor subunit TctC